MNNIINFDESEFQQGLTAKSLQRIANLFDEDIEDVTRILDPPVVMINVDMELHTISNL